MNITSCFVVLTQRYDLYSVESDVKPQINKQIKYLLCDSLSSLQALDSNNCEHPFIQGILKLFNDCCSLNKKLVLAWVPSHVGIKGNENADELAKQALNFNVLDLKVPYTDLKVNVNSVFKQKWQAQWNACPDNKLFQINPTVGNFYVWTGLSRREEKL